MCIFRWLKEIIIDWYKDHICVECEDNIYWCRKHDKIFRDAYFDWKLDNIKGIIIW